MTKRLKGQAGKIDEFIGKRLLQFRHLSGLSQAVLAESTGTTFQQIQKYEKGINRIAAPRLYEFAKILNVNVDDFFDRYETNPQGKLAHLIDQIPSDFSQVIAMLNGLINPQDKTAAVKIMMLVVKIFKEAEISCLKYKENCLNEK